MPNYTYPNSLTVKNKLGALAHDDLERLEAPLVAARDYQILLGGGPGGDFDGDHLKAFHHYICSGDR